ncbi:S8 family serine peptidase [Actinokineospora iranica]|uniref:S8 family serine peptidase n=1 Tax=Actinokineospora iranica TaxID=1271860 RepID=UPI00158700FE|nr:S8 family serine peptidase [Actinokineospora iranica]
MVCAAAAPATADSAADRPRTASARTVTLITGDRVLVPANGAGPAVQPADGRVDVVFHTHTVAGHLHVIPADALPLVSSGTLDRRLFDVTGLLEAGYDDRRADLPLIQSGPAPAGLFSATGVRAVRDLPSVGARALSADKAALAGSWRSLVGEGTLWLDGKRQATLDRSTAQIGAPEAWRAGLDGSGVTVAVLDTGVDQTHPDLASREVGERNFTDSADTVDRVGHGTHVASTIAGTGGKYKGVAHGAKLLDGKVLDDFGSGQESWIVAGMEWAAEQGADIVNLSLGGSDGPEEDPLEAAVNRLSAEKGTLFVISAGNAGPRARTVSSPGSADAALTVGSVERDDSLSFFSSRGPRIGDGAVKPDITGPGSGIVAAKAAQGQIGDPVEPGYVSLSGTSMAAPHVAGAAAILAQRHPEWSGARLKAALTASAKPTQGLSAFEQGSGRVDVPAALAQTLTTEPSSVSLGTQLWPHDDDKPVSKEFTYRNSGDQPVTLDLTTEVLGPDGKPAPQGMITLSSTRVAVPAGGTASVQVIGDTRLGSLDGMYSGAVVATTGTAAVRTPLAVEREVESYDLRATFLGPDGKPTAEFSTLVVGLDSDFFTFAGDPEGVVDLRLPKGRYILNNLFAQAATRAVQHLPYPGFEMTKKTDLVVDARVAKPIKITPPDPAAEPALSASGYSVSTPERGASFTVAVRDPSTLSIGQIGPELPADMLTWSLNVGLESPTAYYGLAWFQDRAVPTGFTRAVRQQDLATVRTTVGQVVPGTTAARFLGAVPAAGDSGGFSIGRNVRAGVLTEHLLADNTRWNSSLMLFGDTPQDSGLGGQFIAEPLVAQAGKTYRQRVNVGVFGPALPRAEFPWLRRFDVPPTGGNPHADILSADIGLFGDGGGNAGFTATTAAKTTLYRDGVKIGETAFPAGGSFEIPKSAGRYTLAAEGSRDARFGVSTHVAAKWTFDSKPGRQAAPISVVRFHAELDAENAAPTGRYLLPVTLQLENGAKGQPRRLSVDVSYDEGKTWHRATVIAKSLVVLDHPAGASSVSLRAAAEDSRGSTVEQTIVRAYQLGKR